MRGFFDEEERKPARSKGKSNSELTLGSGMLLTVFFGLVVVCGLCFGAGYIMGSHGASEGPVFQNQQPATGPTPQMQANSPQVKPAPGHQPPTTPNAADGTQQGTAAGMVAANTPGAAAPGTNAGTAQGSTQGSTQGSAQGSAQGATSVTTAANATPYPVTGATVTPPNDAGWHKVVPNVNQAPLTGDGNGAQDAQPTSADVHPAMSSTNPLMVQIAAVSNQKDADVLLRSLRHNGYDADAVHSSTDNMIHICIGPFNNMNDAASMREKLLSAGYNAVILP